MSGPPASAVHCCSSQNGPDTGVLVYTVGGGGHSLTQIPPPAPTFISSVCIQGGRRDTTMSDREPGFTPGDIVFTTPSRLLSKSHPIPSTTFPSVRTRSIEIRGPHHHVCGGARLEAPFSSAASFISLFRISPYGVARGPCTGVGSSLRIALMIQPMQGA